MLIAAIIAAIAAGIAGGAAAGGANVFADISKFWRKQFKKLYKDDPEKLAAALALWEDVETSFQKFQDAIFGGVASLRDVHVNYDATLDDYLAQVDDISARIKVLQHEIMAQSQRVIEFVGDEDYDRIAAELRQETLDQDAKNEKKDAKAQTKADKKAARQGS